MLDGSGRGHHALLPTSGFTNDFFGLVWDGTTGLSVADSKDFAPNGPFTISADFKLEGELTTPVTVISRGDPAGKFSWAVQVMPGPTLRFSIANDAGEVSTVERAFNGEESAGRLFVSFDPKSGEQTLLQGCIPVSVITHVRPARELPPGSRLQLITGLRGSVRQIELINGLMRPSGPKNCSYTGEQLGAD